MLKEMYRGYEIEIRQDELEEGPRQWDNIGTMVCFHRNYNLGDKHTFTPDEVKLFPKMKDRETLPLYLYDHSGLSISVGREYPFTCPWDSGQVGIIFITREKMKKEFPNLRNWRKKARKIMENEVLAYDIFLRGDVWYYNTPFDSLGGIYGYQEALIEARRSIDWGIKDKLKNHLEKLKKQIKNKVPVQYREALTI